MPKREPKLGDLAFCRRGRLGLITEIIPADVRDDLRPLYKGVLMEVPEGNKLGNWQSVEPHIVGHLNLRKV